MNNISKISANINLFNVWVLLRMSGSKTQMPLEKNNVFHEKWLFFGSFMAFTQIKSDL